MDKEGKQRNEEIENQLKRDKLSQRNEIKMLLLGNSRCTVRTECMLKSEQELASLESQPY